MERQEDVARRIVRDQEDAIRHDRIESLYAFDRQGNLVFSKRGQGGEVTLEAGEIARLKDMVVTHNTPEH